MPHTVGATIRASLVALATALMLAGCGVPAVEPTGPYKDHPGQLSSARLLTQHDNSYLSIGIAEGWFIDPEAPENVHFDDRLYGNYTLVVIPYDSTINHEQLFVSVYDRWMIPSDNEIEDYDERSENRELIEGFEVDGVMLSGTRSVYTDRDTGLPYYITYFWGTVNNHYLEVTFVDRDGDLSLGNDLMRMAQSIHVK